MKLKLMMAVFLFSLSILLTGCFKGEANIQIKEDGSADFEYRAVATPIAADALQKQILELEKNQFTITKFTEGDNVGFKANKHFRNVTELSDYKLFAGKDDKTLGIKVDKGWFFDVYLINIVNNLLDSDKKPMTKADQAILSQLSMKVIVSFPAKPEAHNANMTYNEGKTLEWVLSFSQDNQLQARAKYLHIGHIAFTVLAAALVSFLVYQRQRRQSAEMMEEQAGYMAKILKLNPGLVGVITAVCISGIGMSYYALTQHQVGHTKPVTTSTNNQTGNVAPPNKASAAETAGANSTVNASTSPLRGKWMYRGAVNGMPDSSITMMITPSGNQLDINLSMTNYRITAKAASKAELSSNESASFSYKTQGGNNQGTASIRLQGKQLVLEIQGTQPDVWGIWPGKYVLDRWLD